MAKPIYRVRTEVQNNFFFKEYSKNIKKIINSGSYIIGPETKKFENEFSKYLKVKKTVGVASGTDAICLCLKLLGIKAGDEVITTSFTAFPTILAILMVSAKPVFADIDPDTWLISKEDIMRKITKKTKAIIPVHIFGNVYDVISLRKYIPKKISIIEDAAQAHGSSIDGKKAGSLSNLATFSFYPTKNLGGCGDSGAITTNSPKFFDRLIKMRNLGMKNKDEFVESGMNSRIDELQSLILRAKLKKLDQMNRDRKKKYDIYLKNLNKNYFLPQLINKNVISNYHIAQFTFKGNKEKLINYLSKKKIQTNVYYEKPHHLQKVLKNFNYKKGDLKITEKICKESISLPLYPEISNLDIFRVIDVINLFLKKH